MQHGKNTLALMAASTALLLATGPAAAQDWGQQQRAQQEHMRQQHIHEQTRRNNPNHPGYVGPGRTAGPRMACDRTAGCYPAGPLPRVTGWEHTPAYGAVALGYDREYKRESGNDAGVPRFGEGQTPQDAQRAALQECQEKGARNCQIITTFGNTCISLVTGFSYVEYDVRSPERFYVIPRGEFYNPNWREDAEKTCERDPSRPNSLCSAQTYCAKDEIKSIRG